jgi:uncharacterized protein YggE
MNNPFPAFDTIPVRDALQQEPQASEDRQDGISRRKSMQIIGKLVIVCAVSISLAGCAATASQPQAVQINPSQLTLAGSLPAERSIVVSGDAQINVVPDRAILTLGVESRDASLIVAKQKSDSILHDVLAFLQAQGVDAKDIQTDYLDIQPDYENYDHRVIIGYFVRENLSVTIRNLDKFNDILSGALEAGVNTVFGVEFQTSELRKYRDDARAAAIQAAREKAVAMAKELNQTIGEPINISEISIAGGYYNPWQSQNTANFTQNTAGDSSIEGSLALGDIAVKAKVTVTFRLQD